MVMGTLDQLKKIQRDFEEIKITVSGFIVWATEELDQRSPTHNIVIEDFFPAKVVRKRKRLPGESVSEEPITDAFKEFEVGVHNRILDTTIESLRTRFEKNGELFWNLACLSPVQFEDIKISFPHDALEKLSKVLKKFDNNITKEQLHSELVSLANNWDSLKASLPEEYILTP